MGCPRTMPLRRVPHVDVHPEPHVPLSLGLVVGWVVDLEDSLLKQAIDFNRGESKDLARDVASVLTERRCRFERRLGHALCAPAIPFEEERIEAGLQVKA